MMIDVGDVEPIPEDERLRRYADGFFRDHYLWLQVRAINFCQRHKRYCMEDALTEAWLKLPGMLSRYDPELAAIKTYLSKQLYWCWLRHCYGVICKDEKIDKFVYRKEYYEPLVEGISDIELDRVDSDDEREYIVSKIKNVDKRGQVVLSLRYINGMTMSEIAVVLGCVKSMVHVYVHRALAQITPVLEKTYGTDTKTTLPHNGAKAT